MTIECVEATGIIADDKTPHNVDDRRGQAKPEHTGKQAPESRAGAADPPRRPAAPGRRPLFRH